MTNQNGFDSDEQEQYYRKQYEEREQEPNVVPCFRCNDAMYEMAEDPKDNICETCEPPEIMLDNWGKHLDIPREKMESDDSYKKRLVEKITKKPNTLMEDIKKSNVGNYEIIDNWDGSSLTITANEKDSQIMKDILINHMSHLVWPFCKFKVDPNYTFNKEQ